jgi:hypothetical protein
MPVYANYPDLAPSQLFPTLPYCFLLTALTTYPLPSINPTLIKLTHCFEITAAVPISEQNLQQFVFFL